MKLFTISNLTVSILIVGAFTLGHWQASKQFVKKTLTPPATKPISPVQTQSENSNELQLAQAKPQINTLQQRVGNTTNQAISEKYTLAETDYPDNKIDPVPLHNTETDGIQDPMQSLLDNAPEIEARLANFETEFWGTVEDPAATEETEEVLREAFKQQNLDDSEFDTVQCQTRMCVAEFVHQQEKGHDTLLQKLYGIKPFSRGFLVKTEASGEQLRTLVFFPRDGESLNSHLNLNQGDVL